MADANRDVVGLDCNLVFDKDKLTLKSVTHGANAPGVDTLDTYDDLAKANSEGKMRVLLFDFFYGQTGSNPMTAGKNREVNKFVFTIKSGTADGDVPVTLSGIEAGSIENNESILLTYSVTGGKVTVGGAPGDVDGNGKIDIFDLLALLKKLAAG